MRRKRIQQVADSKECAICLKIKPIEQFVNNFTAKSGKGNICKPCDSIKRSKNKSDKKIIKIKESINNVKYLTNKIKRCGKCNQLKDEIFFSKKGRGHVDGKYGLNSVCKYCEIEESINKKNLNATKRQIAKSWLNDYLLKHPCISCGDPRILCLQFDHINDKEYNLGNIVSNGKPIELLEFEAAKCRVLCANCHSLRTAIQRNWVKNRIDQNPIKIINGLTWLNPIVFKNKSSKYFYNNCSSYEYGKCEECLEPGYKRCYTCQEVKLITDFDNLKRTPDGKHYNCRKCKSKSAKESKIKCDLEKLNPTKSLAPGLKECGKCKEIKSIESFSKSERFDKDGNKCYRSICKQCDRDNHIRRGPMPRNPRRKAQDWYIEYLLDHPCVICGEDRIECLHFDHLRDKEHSITSLVALGKSIEEIETEVAKCRILCANCHFIYTASQLNWTKVNIDQSPIKIIDGVAKLDVRALF